MELTIEQILAAQEPSVVEVPVPEWGGSVFVRRISALEMLRNAHELRNKTNGSEIDMAETRLVNALAIYLCDSTGKRIATVEEARAIAAKSANVVTRIVFEAQKSNGLTDGSLDALAKNSAPSPDATSPSA